MAAQVVRPQTIMPGVAAGPVTLETVNQRWAGAACQIRVQLEIQGGRDRQGWSASKWVKPPTLPGDRKVRFRLLVSDRKLLETRGYLYRKKAIRPATMLTCVGWGLAEPRKQRGLLLNLEFAGLPVKARMEFKESDRLEDLEDVERLTRIELFVVSAKAAGPPPSPAPSPAPVAVPVVEAPQVYKPAVRILGASVSPAQLARGAEMDLVITYVVEGLPPGASFPANEERNLLAGDRQLAHFEQQIPRATGTFTSAQKIAVPATLKPGVYRFQARISVAGKAATADALFEVR